MRIGPPSTPLIIDPVNLHRTVFNFRDRYVQNVMFQRIAEVAKTSEGSV